MGYTSQPSPPVRSRSCDFCGSRRESKPRCSGCGAPDPDHDDAPDAWHSSSESSTIGGLLAIAVLFATFFSAAAPAAQFHDQKKGQRIDCRPMKWTARANAGYPFFTTTANISGFVTGIPVAIAFTAFKYLTKPPSAAHTPVARPMQCAKPTEEVRCRLIR